MDTAIIAFLFLLLYFFLRRTEAIKVLAGLLVLYLIYISAVYMDLERSSFLLRKFFEFSAIGIIVVFHPELRAFLKKIGGFAEIPHAKMDFIDQIEEAAYNLSEQNTGALIVFDPKKSITFQTDDMKKINADCTSDILESIFYKNSPLHDGAVIIQNNRIAYAGCKLPLSGVKREGMQDFGTRHLAAIETSERFDTIAIIVSEETGSVSIADSKGITRMNSRESFRDYFRRDTPRKFFPKNK